MTELIKTSAAVIGGEEQQTVSAKELYMALMPEKKDYKRWIGKYLKFGLIEGEDYIKVQENDYILALDAAISLARVTKSDIAAEVRDYLIQKRDANRKTNPVSDLVTIGNTGTPVTTSLKIAEVFGKLHKNVIQVIESLQIPDEWYKLNFQLIQNTVDLGHGRVRQDKAYTITRDGFTILAMGFTGKKAMEFKLAYIEAYNAMENMLKRVKRNPELPSPEILMATLIQKVEENAMLRAKAEEQEAQLRRIADFSTINYGELSKRTGLPKDIIIAMHCKSSTRPHKPQPERFIQLYLPLYNFSTANLSDYIADSIRNQEQNRN